MTSNVGLPASGSSHEHLLRAILECSTDGFIFLDAAGNVREWSAGAERITGCRRQDVVGQAGHSIVDWLFPDSHPGPRHSTIRRSLDGSEIAVLVLTHTLRGMAGQVEGTLILVREAPEVEIKEAIVARESALRDALRALRKSHEELKATQIRLIQAAKLESIGRLAAGVAHEVKNPLAILLTGVQLLQRRAAKAADDNTRELLADLETAVKRANGVIVGMLDFAASTDLTLTRVDLEDLVTESIHFVQHEMVKRHVRLTRERMSDVPPLSLDRAKIEQVLLNLMMNAMGAMPDGGTLTMRTGLRQLSHPAHGVGFRKSDVMRVGQTVAVVEIEDTGTGIPPDVLPRVFDPFFTTKTAGSGTGLGLAVCRMIAGLHRGSVWLENRSEGGARATLLLPAGESWKEQAQ